ncbi:MAG: Mpv17 / PMP22 family [Rhodobacteraceae bacterium HLUCCA12]|nr:MAG: Mpv17 / PMP22 family [Rhodobacteraceae bacterium HLUCCA12]
MKDDLGAASGTGHATWQRTAAVWILFVALGPFFGALSVNILLSVMAAMTAAAGEDYGAMGRLLAGGIVIGTIVSLPIAYGLGLASAAGVGAVAAIADRRKGTVPWPATLFSALIFWLAVSALAMAIVPPEGWPIWAAALLAAHLLGTTICVLLARGMFAPR